MSFSDYARNEVEEIDFQALKEAGIERKLEDFYILGNYPPLTALHASSEAELLDGNTQNELDIYIHFQFCNQLCNFCHFNMDQSARTSEDPKVARYLDSLKKEISLWNEKLGGITARSIYIGGGTPTFMSERQIEDLFMHLYSEIKIPRNITITFDMHPEVIHGGRHKLQLLKDLGVNRASIGGVDLNDEVLQNQQRGHTSRDVVELIHQLTGGEFRSRYSHVAVDLVMGVQYQTLENWEKTIEALTGGACMIGSAMTFPHMFKASQINWKQYQQNPEMFPTVKDRAAMQLIAMDMFKEAGYTHAPVYYFNMADREMNYQQIRKFETLEESGLLGIGVSSFGFINSHQYFNTPYMDDYHVSVASGQVPVWRASKLTQKNLFERAVMFNLKSRGIGPGKAEELEEKFGFNVRERYHPIIKRLENLDLLEYAWDEGGDILQLTRKGMLFAEEVCNCFAGDDVRQRANLVADMVDPRSPTQRFNYNMIGHRL